MNAIFGKKELNEIFTKWLAHNKPFNSGLLLINIEQIGLKGSSLVMIEMS
jgi:hypothetical protein